jgi:cephalosporin hydroxylase
MAGRRFRDIIKDEIIAFGNILRRRLYMSRRQEKNVVNAFHKLYYDAYHFGKTIGNTFWMGVPIAKCPFDLWVYQELIHELKPDAIIETGTSHGGSALFLAHMCDLVKNGKVITVDISTNPARPKHPRITYLVGSSVSESIEKRIKAFAKGARRVLLILDSDHRRDHVLRELQLYAPLVTKGSYAIVEDSNINGHPVVPYFGPGPMEALKDYLKENKDFAIDKEREKFYLTMNPGGYLKRVR